MTFNKYRSLLAAGAIALLSACTTEVDDFVTAGGSSSDGTPVDYTTYVALGNSLTAGVSDGAWLSSSQVNSYPQLIANSLQEAGLGAKDFKQPLISYSGAQYFGTPIVLTNQGPCFTCTQTVNPTSNIYSEHGGFHNMAVSGMKAIDVNDPTLATGLYGYFVSSAGSTVLKDALSMNPTFFSMWLGANDVLGFANSGGALGPNAITPQADFETAINSVLDSMGNRGAKGAILNVPDITEAALFNTTPNTLEKMLAANNMELTEDFLVLVNGYLASAFDPIIKAQVEVGRPTVTALITPSIPSAAGTINVVAAAVSTAPSIGKDPSVSAELAYTVIFLQLTSGGMTPTDAMTFLATEAGQTQIAQLVALGIDQSWATMTGTDEEVNTIINSSIESTTATLKAAGYYPVFSLESNQLPVYDAASPTMMRVPAEGTLVSLLALNKALLLGELILTGGDLDITKLKDYLPVIDTTKGTYEFLEKGDVDDVKTAIDGYNSYLKEEASSRDLAYVDTKSVMSEAHNGGIIIDGVTYTTTYLSGNLFSLDGAHLTQRGYAVIGNYTIQAINAKYGAKIPQIQQNDFPVVETTVVPTPAAAN
ncbi:SGNH/GDSL hydrolase family protein [Flammeovirga kamogawensis]|uniref:G-D-S-L family lipolytic protein n=1 Tax=Flammeovirga kamogawensis TaxID=373891 RepID=A0ABX8GSJ6_9BACT|nr:hypothetical protein [Flammeovirga kamogawensis]MBB6461502.1 lysophospholipase L1-like esterase [Flammeovirga kamogawensis]QWG06394.1 hypothetical protein KM029_13770 [Flammeovirga kamogawensis]TRX68223.1 hypothetical protein EO216_08785 [Flammeovirga kamogawensis]